MAIERKPNRHDRRAADAAARTRAPAARVESTAIPGTYQIHLPGLEPADQMVTVDGGYVRIRHGMPEVHLVQLDPYNDKQALRVVVGRFSRELFVERAKVNIPFLDDLEQKVFSERVPRGEPEHFVRLTEAASRPDRTAIFIAEVLVETIVYVGDRGAMTLYVANIDEFSRVARGEPRDFNPKPYVQSVMSVNALADLLISWKRVAKELGHVEQ